MAQTDNQIGARGRLEQAAGIIESEPENIMRLSRFLKVNERKGRCPKGIDCES